MLDGLPRNHFRVIYADPAWHWRPWVEYDPDGDQSSGARNAERHYDTMEIEEIAALPVADVAADDCVLLIWVTWPLLRRSFEVIDGWGFEYKTCGFDWMKANVSTIDLFPDPKTADMKLGHWTRSNSEPCLLATRGKPSRVSKSVRMGIIEPAREHSRKPDCVPGRIEQLVDGPYLEMFARTTRPGWTCVGNQVDKFKEGK